MPVQTLSAVPWEQLADAHEQLADAERHGEPADVDAAREYLRSVREELGLLGTLLVMSALELGSMELQKKLAAVFGQLGVEAFTLAQAAHKRAGHAEARLDAIEQRLREMQRLVDNLTPGVGYRRAM